MRRLLSFLKIRKGEWWLAIVLTIWIAGLQWLIISKYFDIFSVYKNTAFGPFPRNFHVSGFDALIYSMTTNWGGFYTIVMRHPLLIFFLYPLHLINWLLLEMTGINCVQFVIGTALTFCGVYSGIFTRRILRFVLRLGTADSFLVTILTFSFAYIPLTFIVPDHFGFTMILLTYTLFVAGMKMRGIGCKREIITDKTTTGKTATGEMTTKELATLIILTAGVTLTNGAKTIVCSLFVNGRRFFRWKHLLFGAILPMFILWQMTGWEYKYIVRPGEIERADARAKAKERRKKIEAEKKEAQKRKQDSIAEIHALTAKNENVKTNGSTRAGENTQTASTVTSYQKKSTPHPTNKKTSPKAGKPISEGKLMQWSDATTSRWKTIKDNLLGESIQFHDLHLLEDVNMKRPVFVEYTNIINDIAEIIITLLYIYGIWRGRREKFLWLMTAWMSIDMILHLGFGFGINEVYIMSGHWLFVISLTIGYAFVKMRHRTAVLYATRSIVAILTAFLLLYNQYYLVKFLMA